MSEALDALNWPVDEETKAVFAAWVDAALKAGQSKPRLLEMADACKTEAARIAGSQRAAKLGYNIDFVENEVRRAVVLEAAERLILRLLANAPHFPKAVQMVIRQ